MEVSYFAPVQRPLFLLLTELLISLNLWKDIRDTDEGEIINHAWEI